MKGTWETKRGGSGLLLPVVCVGAGVLLAGGGTVAAITGFLTSLVEVAGAVIISLIALAALIVVLVYRRGWRPSLNPVVAWNPHAVAEAQNPRPVPARPGPQIVNNFYGVTPEQVADAIARQQRVIEGR